MEEIIRTLLPAKIEKNDSSYSTVKDLDKVLRYAKSKNIRNVALTGPFGSGKSSVLHTLMEDFHENGRVYLPISLATLQADEDFSKSEKQDKAQNAANKENLNRKIEYSILQQIIYREKAKDVPNSRFRRIVHLSKEDLCKYSWGCIATIISFLIVFEPSFAKVDTLYNFFDFGYKLNCLFDFIGAGWLLFSIAYVFRYIINFYSNSKLNKLNLKDGEIEVVEDNSIFNKHLDEILYFFQVTKYNVVIIEDLDRFETPNIFLKLRELCQLLNESKIIDRHITFIYAIKDDVFENEERTKFFDYITTVIPVINPSNSKDKLKSALEAQGFSMKQIPCDEDLSEMAFFIQDMRILTNIVNEYKQYYCKLCNGNQKLDYTKLLAMIVYKNYFPHDFALLHRREGKVYACISKKREFINEAISYVENKIKEINNQIDKYNETKILKVRELRLLFLYKLRNDIQNNLYSIEIDNNCYSLEEIAADEKLFAKLLKLTTIRYNYYYTYGNRSNSSDVNFEVIDKDTQYIYKANLISKGISYYTEEKKKLEKDKRAIISKRISELLTKYKCGNLEIYKGIGLSPLEDVFLRRGYIDEEYYDYISYFYEGMVSLSDRDLLLKIKQDLPQPYEYHIDKVENFVKELRPYMFDSDAILNNELLDCISQNSTQSENFSHFMDKLERDDAQLGFMAQYYQYGNNAAVVYRHFINWNREKSWENIMKWDNSTEKNILIEGYLKFCGNISDTQQLWLNENYKFLVEHYAGLELERCIRLVPNSKFRIITNDNVELLDCVIDNNAYKINNSNLIVIVRHMVVEYKNIEDCELNYTHISSTNNVNVVKYINDNIEDAIGCFKDSNKNETQESIIHLLNHDGLDISNKQIYLCGQRNLLENFDKINDGMYEYAIKWFLIKPTWKNVETYYAYKGNLTQELIDYIEKNAMQLAEQKDTNEDNNLFFQLFGEDILENASYMKLLFCFDCQFTNHAEIKELCDEKLKMLIVSDKIAFNENMVAIMNETNLLAEFLIQHKDTFIKNLQLSYGFTGECVSKLFSSGKFSKVELSKILELVPTSILVKTDHIADEAIVVLLEMDDCKLEEQSIFHFIEVAKHKDNAVKMATAIIENSHSDYDGITSILNLLGNDYAEISNHSQKAKIKDWDSNHKLLECLKGKGFISSYKKEKDFYRVYHKTKV